MQRGEPDVAEAQADPLAPDEPALDIDEHPQRRRQWSGPWRSVVLPVLAVTVIAAAVYYVEARPAGSTVISEGDTVALGLLPLPADKNPTGARPEASKGKPAPDFVLRTSDGGILRLSDLRGQPVVLNFWATWCGPCRAEMPELQTVSEQLRELGLVVVAVNVQESRGKVAEWRDQFGLTFPVVLDLTGKVSKEYLRVSALPTTLFVGRDGTVLSIHRGQLDRQAILDGLAQILP